MNKTELSIMNKSFSKLDDRRASLLLDERTIDLKETVKEIRKNSIKHLHLLLEIAEKNLEDNGMDVIFAKDADRSKTSHLPTG